MKENLRPLLKGENDPKDISNFIADHKDERERDWKRSALVKCVWENDKKNNSGNLNDVKTPLFFPQLVKRKNKKSLSTQ